MSSSQQAPYFYVGIYVDDFIYFSAASDVEASFEQNLKSHTDVDFMGNVNYFLGIKFSRTKHAPTPTSTNW